MFARQTRPSATALVFALFVTAGMLGAVDSRATHAADALQMAESPVELHCPAHG